MHICIYTYIHICIYAYMHMSKLIYWGTTNYKNTRQAFEPEKPASRLTPPMPPITLPSHPPPSHTSSITQSSTSGSRPASQPCKPANQDSHSS